MMHPLQLRRITRSALALLKQLEKTQWTHTSNADTLKEHEVLTRDGLRQLKMAPGLFACRTSGSTGEPVTVQKTEADQVWLLATNVREYIWRKWDFSKTLASIKPGEARLSADSWGLPRSIAPIQGPSHKNGYLPISELQSWLESIQPDYLSCAPSIRDALDLSRLTYLIDWKGTGERGGTMYSSEECGTIAIQCPDNKINYHVMENQIVERDSDGGMIITTLTNPYIRRYKHGDHIELGRCDCGRTLQTITAIKGRIRNMLVLPNGDKKWPLFGSRTFHERFGIKQFKLIQTSLTTLTMQIMGGENIDPGVLASEINALLDGNYEIKIECVCDFGCYKFEEFVSLL